MTLLEFMNLWAIHNKTLLICNQNTITDDEVVQILDNIELETEKYGITAFQDLKNCFLICAIDTSIINYTTQMYLREEINNAEVSYFSIYKDYVILFIRRRDDELWNV